MSSPGCVGDTLLTHPWHDALCSFEALPSSERTVLQLCDLEDDEIQSLLRAPAAVETADAAHGEPADAITSIICAKMG